MEKKKINWKNIFKNYFLKRIFKKEIKNILTFFCCYNLVSKLSFSAHASAYLFIMFSMSLLLIFILSCDLHC